MSTTSFTLLDDGNVSLTSLEIEALEKVLNSGDRGAFHYIYYQMSGTEDKVNRTKSSLKELCINITFILSLTYNTDVKMLSE